MLKHGVGVQKVKTVRTNLRKVTETSECGLHWQWQFCLKTAVRESQEAESPGQTKEMGPISVSGSEARWSLVTIAT